MIEILRAEAPVSFARFMEVALYHPERGYYASGRARVGRAGDFFTNVSVGPLYGRLLARQFEEMWRILGEPSRFDIVEQGAHGGDFAADVLAALRGTGCARALRYHIVEPFPRLRERQRQRLAAFDVEWHDDIPPFEGVHFSNELPDAFPVHLVKWDGSAWVERLVAHDGAAFHFTDTPLTTAPLREACAALPRPATACFLREINLAARDWVAAAAAKLACGFILAVDYGFLEDEFAERPQGTLAAYANHRREPDPLAHPGELDLTAHVDFTSLIAAAKRAGLALAGYTDQHHFMVGLGAGHFADGANTADVRAFQTLMHPQMMGLAFKAVCFAKGTVGIPCGFQFARPL